MTGFDSFQDYIARNPQALTAIIVTGMIVTAGVLLPLLYILLPVAKIVATLSVTGV